MKFRHAIGAQQFALMTTGELRETFLLEDLFAPGEIELVYWETDRAVIGSIVPTQTPLRLETAAPLASQYFCERREVGIINIGAPGNIRVDGTVYSVDEGGCLYIGRGCREVVFASSHPENPAKFFLLSYPAHTSYPTTVAQQSDATQLHLGAPETANQRTIFQYIHENGIKSCQLVMGFTRLETGSVWNTMPPHTHSRRSEVYLYFDVPQDAAVVHLMGPGDETRHLMLHAQQAVLSPIWSIHSGCGTRAYSFIWAMGGENQRFDDMDIVPAAELK